ncbi:LOW QUALITY PROTEIN: RNA polymerase sigma factor sigB-like [Actinidia eriantha]|uniref:LOW QUALITY PROTEIN: RNA polymerase sigma factor sigB-like n=1 Tax=Actinidia eriantha TaxID=165200 RepID=UPI00258C00EC|nr:LOW QUALITY PROTEIN: RNA polymerase sigma factor sigB-like [Actinidia eriantha]
MSCLLPPFKCLPDSFSLHSRTHTTHLPKGRDPFCFRTQCLLSTTSPPTSTATNTMLDMEKMRLLSLATHSNAAAADRPWTCIGTICPPTEANFGSSLATETLIANEEATIAAAEALALAKAAVRVAKDAAMMVFHSSSTTTDTKSSIIPSEVDTLLFNSSQLAEKSTGALPGLGENLPLQCPIKEDDLKPSSVELELLEKQISRSIAVRSSRQTERKVRRARAAEKAAANVVSVKSGSTSRRKRTSSQDLDFSDPLRYFRGATSNSRLLTFTEEQELSEGIQDLLKLEKLQEELAERCDDQPTFAQWADAAGVDQKTLRKRLNYGIFSKEKMIKSNIRLVISIAKNYQGAGLNLQDLVQEGCRGLVRGAEKFDASKGFRFSTYAHWWIKQAVRRSLSDQARTIRLPIHMVEATYRVKEARKQLYSENGRQPNNEEVAEATGLSMKRLHAVLLTPKAPRSLDQKIGMNLDLKPSEVISHPDAETSEELLMKQFMRKDLEKVLDTLKPREKQVVQWRFGLEDGRMKTLQEIGELMGVSRERIRQIETCAFRKLKNKRRIKHLQHHFVS